jgi:hypothetical protein
MNRKFVQSDGFKSPKLPHARGELPRAPPATLSREEHNIYDSGGHNSYESPRSSESSFEL